MEKRWTGPDSVRIKGLNTGTLDLTETHWGHEVRIQLLKYRRLHYAGVCIEIDYTI